MSTHSHNIRRWFVLVVVGLLCLTALTPTAVGATTRVRADTNLTIGGQAKIVNTNGDRVRLRSAPGYDASVVTMLGEGDVVTVENGPVTADDGSLWYEVVTADGFDGYLAHDYLQLDDGSTASDNGDSQSADNSDEVAQTPEAQGDTGADGSGEVTPAADETNGQGDGNVEATAPADDGQGDVVETPTDVQDPNVVETPTDVQDSNPVETPTTDNQDPNAAVTPTIETQEPTQQAETPVATDPSQSDNGGTTPEVSQTPDTGDAETPTTNPDTAETPTTDTGAETPTSDTGAGTTPAADTGSAETPTADTGSAETPTSDTGAPATPGAGEGVTPTTETSASPTAVATQPSATAPAEPSATAAETVTPESTPNTDESGDVTAEAQPQLSTLLQPQAKQTTDDLPAGTGIVTGTNGDGLRCRATPDFNGAIITVLPEGAKVTTTGGVQGDWQAVNCAGQDGFVYSQYIATGGNSPDNSGGSGGGTTVTGSAVVTGTNGDGLRCRTGAGYDAAVITVMPEGTSVQLRGSAQGDWQPVFCAGQSGWAFSQYLSASGSSGGDNGGSGGGSGGSSVTGTAVVTGTNGDGLRCRTSAGYDGSVIVVVPDGQQVDLRGSAQGDWTPVVCGGQSGWMFSQYLSTSGSSGGNNGGSSSGSSGGSSGGNSSFPAGSSATVTGTGGDGVNLRSSGSLSASVITVVPEGATVQVRSGSTASWIAVTYNGSNGFISADYLSSGGGGSSGGGNNGGSSSGGGLSVGAHAMTTDSLNLRYSASLSAGVAAVAPAGTVVQITSGLSNGFYGVDWDGLDGYMYGDYLQATNAALTPRGGSGDSSGGGDTGGNAGSGSGSATGQEIANYALQYVGYPYVWAAAGPSAFDCSGFTEWVIQHTLGIDITHDMFQQYADGTPVAYGNLQPGDLVFFQNTYEWGLSHVGIYIGNNQFVHAENENTGVVVSDITSQYYSSRWYGAVRYGS